jgi:endonuclease/exonuclease/phosphatase family metal-dependent hydrolase
MHLFSTIIFILISMPLAAQSVKVMTYNIRLDTETDGVNQWKNRTHKVVGLIKKYNPDLFGVQEALHNQMTDLKNNLPEFDFVGVARDDGKEKGEYSAIFYKKEKFEVLMQSTFWLSETPEVPGSKSWDAAITRVVTWAKLKEKKGGTVFLIANTHFDHMGKEARLNSARMIKKFAATDPDIPVIVTGDFNAQPDEPPYQTIVEKGDYALYDSRPASSTAGTFCNFGVNAMACKTIDYIFHSRHWKTKKYQVIRDHDGTYYPSDHLPVMATLSVLKK